jgi:hypothetical protein
LKLLAEKAAYPDSLLRFVKRGGDCPLAQTGSLNICLFNHDPFGHHLESITGKPVSNRPIKLTSINRTKANLSSMLLETCQLPGESL